MGNDQSHAPPTHSPQGDSQRSLSSSSSPIARAAESKAIASSWRSNLTISSSDDGIMDYAESTSTMMSSVHSNLMRSHRRRDPMKVYQVIHVLGEGSMVGPSSLTHTVYCLMSEKSQLLTRIYHVAFFDVYVTAGIGS